MPSERISTNGLDKHAITPGKQYKTISGQNGKIEQSFFYHRSLFSFVTPFVEDGKADLRIACSSQTRDINGYGSPML